MGFFFLLSGFVLAYNYADRALALDAREFWLARFARLYPIYLLGLAISYKMFELEWQVRPHDQFWSGLVLTPLLLQGWSPLLATFWNTVGWTLSSEVLLYGAFPWMIKVWAQRASSGNEQMDTPRRLIGFFLVFWIAGMIPHVLYLLVNPDHLAEPINRYTYAYWLRALKYTPPAYVCMFLAGITLGRLQLQLRISDLQRFSIALLGLLATASFFYWGVPHVPYLLMHGGLLLPLFAMLTIGLSGAHPLAYVFAWPPLLAIGETTFCLYMLHFNFINLLHVLHVWERLHVARFDPWISYVSALLLAALAHHLVEAPARRLILRRFSAKAARQAGTPSSATS